MKSKLPKGWKILELDEIAFVQTGLAVNGQPDRVNPIRLPYLRVANVQDGHIDLSEIKYITVSKHQVARYALQVGDVLMTEGGDFDKLGRGAVWKGQIAPCLHQNHVFSVRPDQTKIIPAFLASYCESAAGKRYFLSCSKQTTNLASINSTQLKEMPIAVPSLPEQQRIVMALDAWDSAIEHTERLVKAKRRRKTAWMQTLFGNLPKRPLLEAADVRFSGVDKKTRADETAILLCNYMDVFHNSRITSKLDFMRATASPSQIASNSLRKHDVVFTKDSETSEEIAEPALIAEDIDNLVCGYHLAIARPRDGVGYGPFIAQAMRHPTIRWQFSRLANGVVRFGLTLDAIEQAEIFLPSLDVQKKIAAVLDAEDLMIEDLSARAELLRTQKRGLMQKLLTGERRLDEHFDPSSAPRQANLGAVS